MSKLDSLARRVPRAFWKYSLAIVSVAVSLSITNSLERYTTLRTPLFYMAIIVSAWFGGMGPGLLAVALSTVALVYFTTKPNGMGMGLAICRSIIEAHDGLLWASPNSPRGSVFQFTLPADGEKMS